MRPATAPFRALSAFALVLAFLAPAALSAPAGGLPLVTPACPGGDVAAAALAGAGAVPFEEDPGAGAWATWYVRADAVPVLPAPQAGSATTARELAELHEMSLRRTPEQAAKARAWDEGPAGKRWTETALKFVEAYSKIDAKQNPPRISRELAILEIAMYDALVATWRAKACYQRPPPSVADPALAPLVPPRSAPSYPSEHAAAAGAAAEVLKAFFPDPDGGIDALAREAAESRLWAGANYRSDVDAGLALGREVARRVLAARATDGHDRVWDGAGRLTGRCNWQPTAPAYVQYPAEPAWGQVRPFLLANGSQFRPPPPPACDGADYEAQTRDLYEASRVLTPRQRAIAHHWAGNPGSETPPGMNVHLALNESLAHGLSTMRSARVMSHVAAAVADAGIAAWDAKFTYWSDRPILGIRRTIDPAWSPEIATPPFPGYVSGHATFSGAATAALAGFFPDDEVLLRALGTEAAMSRFYGGIHIRADNERGLELGARIAEVALARAAADGSGLAAA